MAKPAACSRMRICLIAHSDSPWAPFYSRYFRDRGHALLVVSFHPKRIPGIPMHYVGVKAADGRLPKSIYLRRVGRIRRLLSRWKPDVVLATYLRSNGLVGALTKCSALVVSSRGADHDWGLPGILDRRLTRWLGGRAELVHVSSPELAENLTAAGIERGKIAVIPLGTDPREFFPRNADREPGPLRILCTRKHFPIYDNDTIIRAMALLDREGLAFECRFAGTGPMLDASKRLAGSLGLDGRIRFVGEVEHEEILPLLRWADVFVSAAHSDGAPSSLFEAMSCGVFPVVSDVRANRDWIENGRTGILCRVGRPEDWAKGVRFAWENPRVRSEAAQVNRPLVQQRCDREAGLRALEEILMRAVRIYRAGRRS